MEEDQESRFPAFGAASTPPARLCLAPFSPSISPSPRRLSSHFAQPSHPVSASRQLTWLSLQGRLIGASEATSARTISRGGGGGLSKEEAMAWELFSPMHRVLIVAVVAVAAANLKNNREMFRLRRAVDIRDQVLLSMQQKLDNLCDQMNSMKDESKTGADILFAENINFTVEGMVESDGSKFCSCRHHVIERIPQCELKDCLEKESGREEMFKMPNKGSEQEERRMSDLSDWCSSVTSSVDIQLNSLAVDQEIYNLQKECEEKDATIKELAAIAQSSNIAGSKRVAELEDIVRRKNMIIAKLKKDMVILEQKVLHLTRLRRPSFSASASNTVQLPVMATNLVYDMDSSTSPSSSDSDCNNENGERRSEGSVGHNDLEITDQDGVAERKHQGPSLAKAPISLPRSTHKHPKLRPISPLKENSMNHRADSNTILRPMPLVSSGDLKKSRRRIQPFSNDTAPQKRWA